MVVSDEDLFQIRAAASEWLKEHKDSLNASNVRTALINTNPPIPQPGLFLDKDKFHYPTF